MEDLQNVNYGNYVPMHKLKAPSNVRFFYEYVEDREKTEQEKRPIYKVIEMLEVVVGRDRICKEVNESHKHEYRSLYDKFKLENKVPRNGTPLVKWGLITYDRVLELKYFDIETVEELAGMSEQTLQNLPGYLKELVELARAYLDSANSKQAEVTLLKKKNKELQKEVARLQDMCHVLSTKLEAHLGGRHTAVNGQY